MVVARISSTIVERGLGMQEREPRDGLAVPAGRGDERDLVVEEPRRPRVVVGGGPAACGGTAPPRAPARGRARAGGARAMRSAAARVGREHALDRVAVRVGAVDREREPQRQARGRAGSGGTRSRTGSSRRLRRGSRRGTTRPGCAPTGRSAGRGRAAPRSRTARTATCAGRSTSESACSMPANRSRDARREQRGAAVGRVDVHPDPAVAAHAPRRRRGRRRDPRWSCPRSRRPRRPTPGRRRRRARPRARRR